MALYTYNGKLLTVDGKFAVHEDCCCGGDEPSQETGFVEIWYNCWFHVSYTDEIKQYSEIIYDENVNADMYKWFEWGDGYQGRYTNFDDALERSYPPAKYRFWFNQPTNNMTQYPVDDFDYQLYIVNSGDDDIKVRCASLDPADWQTITVYDNYEWWGYGGTGHYAGYNTGDQSAYTGGLILEIEMA